MASSRLEVVSICATLTHAGRSFSVAASDDGWVPMAFSRLCQRMAYCAAKTREKEIPAKKNHRTRLSTRMARMIKVRVKSTNKMGTKTWREMPRNGEAKTPMA